MESNFEMTTTLFPACNVIQSGKASFDFSERNINVDDFVTQNVVLNGNSRSFFLTREQDLFQSSFIFTRNQGNVGRGSVSTFNIRVFTLAEGFAFVVPNQGLDNYPISGGENLNFRGLTNSFAVVFDLCPDRASGTAKKCTENLVRVKHRSLTKNGFKTQ